MFTDSRIRIAVLVFSLLIAVTAVACQPLPAAPTQDAAPVQPQEAPRDPSDLAPDECVDLLATITDFMRADDYAAVVTLVDTVLDCGIDDELKAGLFFLRAESNMKQGEWQTAIDDYRDALAFGLAAEDAAGARNNICWFFALDNQAEAALPYCEQAVDASPSASYLDSRALAYALLGQNEAAIADFEAALAEWAGSQNPQIQAIRTEREEWVATLPRRRQPDHPGGARQAAGRGRPRAQRRPRLRLGPGCHRTLPERPAASLVPPVRSGTGGLLAGHRTRPGLRNRLLLSGSGASVARRLGRRAWRHAARRLAETGPSPRTPRSRPYAHAPGGLRRRRRIVLRGH